MSEMQKDFERLEDLRFAKIAEDCPWKYFMCHQTEKCDKTICAIWHFIKKLTE